MGVSTVTHTAIVCLAASLFPTGADPFKIERAGADEHFDLARFFSTCFHS